MAWRLGLDLGTNSLGWAALELDDQDKPCGILAAGSRIFSDGRDPKSGASLAVDRRAARAMRRRRDRFKQRQTALLKHLTKDGLFPKDEAERKALADKDPYELRARALDEKLTLPELGRAFFHLNQRRGFQSNRKADRKDEDAGKIAVGIDRLRDAMEEAGARTFGKFLHMRRASAATDNAIPSVRTRLRPENGEGAKGDGYDFYPGRDLLKEEFDAIWKAQQPHHRQVLKPEVRKRLFEIIFHQRPLKTPLVGMCTLVPGERRLPKAHPLFQRRRLLEELNALMIVRPGEKAERLTPEQRDLLLLKLKDRRKVAFESLRKTLKLDPAARFNKESEHRTELKGDEVATEMGAKTRFGTRWAHLSPDAQWAVIERQQDIESKEDEAAFKAWLTGQYDLTPEQAKAVTGARLPSGYGRFGPTATTKLIGALDRERDADGRVIVYSEAVDRADLGHHSDFRNGEVLPELPYYGEVLERHVMPGDPTISEQKDPAGHFGRLTNPTVHIGLNQLRRVVNRLIRAYGPPKEIALELARELKLSDDEKKRRNQENNKNRLAAEGRSAKLLELGQHDGGANRALLKLWEELNPGNVLDRRCIYTGEQISIDMLFSGAVEVDHILPFDTTLDDSNANKIVCLQRANREKRKRSPYEAWGYTDRWPEIAERAARLPRNKRWRFEPDAMERFVNDDRFLDRQLVDTQYLGRLARDYLTALYPEKGEGSGHVWVSPGRLTEMVRRKMGLNSLLPDHNLGAEQPKNRKDHRHHTIDAAVVAILDRGMLKGIARASGQGQDAYEEVKIRVPDPWPGFRDDLKRTLDTITVAHRPDHGTVSKAGLRKGHDQTAGRLHKETAYGLTRLTDKNGAPLVVHRVPIDSLGPEHLVTGGQGRKPAWIADPVLRQLMADATAEKNGPAFTQAVMRFAKAQHSYTGVCRVRLVEPVAVKPIRDNVGRAYKGYAPGSNHHFDVWEMPDGEWKLEVVSMFDAHQVTTQRRPHPAARKVLRLAINDVIAFENAPGQRELARVVKASEGQIVFAPVHEAGKLADRHKDPADGFRYIFASSGNALKRMHARQVRVDELGRVLDPGFPARKKVRRTKSRPIAAE